MKKLFLAAVLMLAVTSCAFADASADLLKASRNQAVPITVEKLYEFLDQSADINAKDRTGTTPLMYLVEYADAEIVRAFIEAGADVDAQDRDGCTVLMTAAENNFEHPDVISLIIAAGADVDAQDDDGVTALMIAAEESSTNQMDDEDEDEDDDDDDADDDDYDPRGLQIINILLKAGADKDIEDYDGRTAIDYAQSDKIKDALR